MAYLALNSILKMHMPYINVQTQAEYPLKICIVDISNTASTNSVGTTTYDIKRYIYDPNNQNDYSLNVLSVLAYINKNEIQNKKFLTTDTLKLDYKPGVKLRDNILIPSWAYNGNSLSTGKSNQIIMILDNNNAVVSLLQTRYTRTLTKELILDRYGFPQNGIYPLNGYPINFSKSNFYYDIIKHVLGFDDLYPVERFFYVDDILLNKEIKNIEYTSYINGIFYIGSSYLGNTLVRITYEDTNININNTNLYNRYSANLVYNNINVYNDGTVPPNINPNVVFWPDISYSFSQTTLINMQPSVEYIYTLNRTQLIGKKFSYIEYINLY